MSKKRGAVGSKDKGRGRYQKQDGLGRLRRANAKQRARSGDLSKLDDDTLDELTTSERFSHSGENLLARFNRQARQADTPGQEQGSKPSVWIRWHPDLGPRCRG